MHIKRKMKNTLKKIIPEPWINFIRSSLLKKRTINTLRDLFKAVSAPVRYKFYSKKLLKMKDFGEVSKNALNIKFGGISDDFWFWLLTKGLSKRPGIGKIMPSMPEERFQLQFTGFSGDETMEEAFSFYELIKHEIKRQGIFIGPETTVLDFGCGWGRIIRFFLKDAPASNLFGIDCDEEIIKVCQSSNLNCNFDVNNIYPPTVFEDNSFDIIYSFSVFSHLSEDAHKQWLTEFKRILKPGGALMVTTRDRDFIISCAKIREMSETDVPFFAKGLANTFQDTARSLMEYADGKYLYEPVGGGGIRDGSFYGETCIPPKYVKTEWVKYFRRLDFINYHKHERFNQNVIFAIK